MSLHAAITSVVFDGSTRPGTVRINGVTARFDDDDEAREVFDALNKQNDALSDARALFGELRSRVSGLEKALEVAE